MLSLVAPPPPNLPLSFTHHPSKRPPAQFVHTFLNSNESVWVFNTVIYQLNISICVCKLENIVRIWKVLSSTAVTDVESHTQCLMLHLCEELKVFSPQATQTDTCLESGCIEPLQSYSSPKTRLHNGVLLGQCSFCLFPSFFFFF